MTNIEIMGRFKQLACMLSPENLSCDGELSRTETDRRYRAFTKEWHGLEQILGRTVTEDEVWTALARDRAAATP